MLDFLDNVMFGEFYKMLLCTEIQHVGQHGCKCSEFSILDSAVLFFPKIVNLIFQNSVFLPFKHILLSEKVSNHVLDE